MRFSFIFALMILAFVVNVKSQSIDSIKASIAQLEKDLKQKISEIQQKPPNFTITLDKLRNELAKRPVSCRICFKETEGSSQCQLNRNSCSDWTSSTNNATAAWTQDFRDDTDERPGGCVFNWKVECKYETPNL